MEEKLISLLVVDDEEDFLRAISRRLETRGFNVVAVTNGEKAIEEAKKQPLDIALVDLKMPGLGGLDVLQQVRLIDPQIVAIVITGYATVDAAVEAMKRGAYDFLPKPFSPDELRLILARALERRQLSREAETLRALKKEHPWLEVVILTGHGSVESAVECAREGAYSYLQKPCEFDKLLEILAEAYKKKVMNRLKIREERMNELIDYSQFSSPLAILRKIRELDK